MKKLFFTCFLSIIAFSWANAQFQINQGNTVAICEGQNFTLTSTDNGDYNNYQWYRNTVPIAGATNSWLNITADPIGFAIYRVTAWDIPNGTTVSDDIQVLKNATPLVDAGPDFSQCPGQPFTLYTDTTLGTYSHTWFRFTGGVATSLGPPQLGSSSSVGVSALSNSAPDTFIVRREGPVPYNCRGVDTVIVSAFSLSADISQASDQFCLGQSGTYTLNVTGGTMPFTYIWSNNTNSTTPSTTDISGGNTQTATITPPAPAGTNYYYATVIDDQGCRAKDSIEITTWPIPTVNLPDDTVVDATVPPGTYTINATGSVPGTYEWTYGGSVVAGNVMNYTFDSDKGGIYTVSLTDANNCRGSNSIRVAFDFGVNAIYIPNVFAPDIATASLTEMDNDTRLKVYGANIVDQDFSFTVYNQWGDVVYQTDDLTEATNEGWDGGNYPAGVYTYVASGKFMDDEEFSKAGAATLMR